MELKKLLRWQRKQEWTATVSSFMIPILSHLPCCDLTNPETHNPPQPGWDGLTRPLCQEIHDDLCYTIRHDGIPILAVFPDHPSDLLKAWNLHGRPSKDQIKIIFGSTCHEAQIHPTVLLGALLQPLPCRNTHLLIHPQVQVRVLPWLVLNIWYKFGVASCSKNMWKNF